MLGKFVIIGDRISFYPHESGEPLRALENLALERIARQLSGLVRRPEAARAAEASGLVDAAGLDPAAAVADAELVVVATPLADTARQLSGLSRQRLWSVSGTITEFQGGNYLLVERAILKASRKR